MKSLRYIAISLAFACIIIIGGCNIVDSIKTPNEDALMAKIFDAFENEQYGEINGYLAPEVVPEDTDGAFKAISEYIDGTVIEYKKTGYNYNVSVTNGSKSETVSLVYNVDTEYDKYVVSMVLHKSNDTGWKIYGYNVANASELEGNGAIIDFKNLDIAQLLLLVYSACCLGLVIYAIVVCAKSPVRLKALWIIVILLLHSGIRIASGAGYVNFSFQIININISFLQKFINGSKVLQILAPIGAILFLCLKRRLIKSAKGRVIQVQIEPPVTTDADIK